MLGAAHTESGGRSAGGVRLCSIHSTICLHQRGLVGVYLTLWVRIQGYVGLLDSFGSDPEASAVTSARTPETWLTAGAQAVQNPSRDTRSLTCLHLSRR